MLSPSLKAFLDLIAFSEGTSTEDITRNNGYDVLVTGVVEGPDGLRNIHEEVFTDYSDHPCNLGHPPIVVRESPRLVSTAAGRYQILVHYWNVYKVQLHLPDFSPASQDAVAIQQIRERHALDLIATGQIQEAIIACSSIWASFPGNSYHQGGKTMETLLAKYREFLNA